MKEVDSDIGKAILKPDEGVNCPSNVVIDIKLIESRYQYLLLSVSQTSVCKHSNDFSNDEMLQINPSLLSSQRVNQGSDSENNYISGDREGEQQLSPATSKFDGNSQNQ